MSDTTSLEPEVQAQVDALAQQKADAVANTKIEELKQNLVQAISGQQPEKPPESWTSLKNETVGMAVEEAEKRILSKIEERDAKLKQEQELQEKQKEKLTQEQQNREWEEMSAQWREAVSDGILPDIAPDVKEALARDADYTKLTPEQQQDAGLKAYNEARLLHIKMKNEGKSSTFYRTIEKYYNKQPAGAQAPVLGNSRSVQSDSGDLKYADVVKRRKEVFGY